MNNTFYITTPIYYVNDVPHIGHMYSTIAVDTISRFKRLTGTETFFLTGTDEHGQKIAQAAEKQGITPKELADKVVGRYHALWSKLGISNDDFIRTTDSRHKQTVQAVFDKLLSTGDIYLGEYEGWYCTPCESFWTESQLMEGNLCPDCGRPTSKMQEPSYFFKMSAYQDRLLEHIHANPDFIKPESRRNEVISFIKEGLRDLSVSRVTFSWGIPVKSDPKHVIYVWVDALVNYISALGYASENETLYNKFWPASYHVVGKDILRFHSVYWPTLLMALGLPLPKSIYAHGWWTVEGRKMSKSFGNVVDPFELTDMFGIDAVRYFLLREVTFGLDGDFSYKALIHRINGDLANDFGNLVTRSLQMIVRYYGGVVPSPKELGTEETKIIELLTQTASEYAVHMNDLAFNKALHSVWELVGALNKYIDESKPWALAKEPESADKLAAVLYTVADTLVNVAILIAPFMPETAGKLKAQLGVGEFTLKSESEIGVAGRLPFGTRLGEITALFPRLDEKAISEQLTAKASKAETKNESKAELIGINDFNTVQLIAAEVKSAVNVPKSDKLLKLQVFDGEKERIIVSGIAKSYPQPDVLVGKKIAIVGNLKPAKLMGIESNGMVLSANDGERHNVVILADSVPAGTRIG